MAIIGGFTVVGVFFFETNALSAFRFSSSEAFENVLGLEVRSEHEIFVVMFLVLALVLSGAMGILVRGRAVALFAITDRRILPFIRCIHDNELQIPFINGQMTITKMEVSRFEKDWMIRVHMAIRQGADRHRLESLAKFLMMEKTTTSGGELELMCFQKETSARNWLRQQYLIRFWVEKVGPDLLLPILEEKQP